MGSFSPVPAETLTVSTQPHSFPDRAQGQHSPSIGHTSACPGCLCPTSGPALPPRCACPEASTVLEISQGRAESQPDRGSKSRMLAGSSSVTWEKRCPQLRARPARGLNTLCGDISQRPLKDMGSAGPWAPLSPCWTEQPSPWEPAQPGLKPQSVPGAKCVDPPVWGDFPSPAPRHQNSSCWQGYK